MNNLTLKKYSNNGELIPVVDSREIATMLCKRHSDILGSIKGYIQYLENGKVRSQNFFIPSTYKTEGNNKTYDCYLLTRKGCDMVANKMTGEKGVLFTAEYVTKFEEMEKELHHNSIKALPQTYIEALKALVVSEEEKLALSNKVEEQGELLTIQAPKVEYHDRVLETGNGMNISIIAKELGMSAKSLNKFLKDKGVQYKSTSQWLLYSKYQDMGLVVNDTIVYQGSYMEKTSHHTKWTEKGRKFIHDLVKQKSK